MAGFEISPCEQGNSPAVDLAGYLPKVEEVIAIKLVCDENEDLGGETRRVGIAQEIFLRIITVNPRL